jgi:hypothetical protein
MDTEARKQALNSQPRRTCLSLLESNVVLEHFSSILVDTKRSGPMLTIDLPLVERELGESLERQYPAEVALIEGSAIDGTMTHWSLALSAAALAIPEIRKIVVALLEANRHRSVTYKGVKLQGYQSAEVTHMIRELKGNENEK